MLIWDFVVFWFNNNVPSWRFFEFEWRRGPLATRWISISGVAGRIIHSTTNNNYTLFAWDFQIAVLYTGQIRERGYALELQNVLDYSCIISYPGSSLVCAGRATVLPRCNPGRSRQSLWWSRQIYTSLIIPDHPGDIKYLITSGVECRMFTDHPGRCR
jgi:hypothetical protein